MLREHGVPVWYSDTNIRGAQQWHDEIGAALRRCDWLIVVLTPERICERRLGDVRNALACGWGSRTVCSTPSSTCLRAAPRQWRGSGRQTLRAPA
ncbi:MAG: hypothetical protein OXU77_22650 [Gammaproteobacteria bacterium]|nr:hypothetical protein [Gammaproteobacteria bacterium]